MDIPTKDLGNVSNRGLVLRSQYSEHIARIFSPGGEGGCQVKTHSFPTASNAWASFQGPNTVSHGQP